ncbi:MAG: DUF6491 family protein [Amphiplicatus sp.]
MVIRKTLGLCLAASLGVSGAADAKTPFKPLGEEVTRICFADSINRWRTVKDEPNLLLVDRGANDWYLLELNGKCADKMRQSSTLTLESMPGSSCLAQGDAITVTDSSSLPKTCRVKRIQPWDEKVQSPDDAGEALSEEG